MMDISGGVEGGKGKDAHCLRDGRGNGLLEDLREGLCFQHVVCDCCSFGDEVSMLVFRYPV